MKIRLYIDEDSMSRALVRALQARGVDVTTALAENMIERPDAEHLAYATQQGRALLSFNVGDFHQLHTIIWLRENPTRALFYRPSNASLWANRCVAS